MKKYLLLIFFLLLNFLTVGASAQMGKQARNWIKVEDANLAANYYYDPASIVNRNGSIRVLLMSDVQFPGVKEKSSFSEMILKCSTSGPNKYYETYIELYSENKLQGDLIAGGMNPDAGTYVDVFGSYISVAKVLCSR